jgi:hypothetical protein
MKEPTVRILICRVTDEGAKRPEVDEVPNRYEWFSEIVGGRIERVDLGHDDGVELWCNEESRLLRLPFNRNVPARAPLVPEGWEVLCPAPDAAAPGTMGVYDLHGTFFLARADEEGHIASLTDADVAKYRALLSPPSLTSVIAHVEACDTCQDHDLAVFEEV